MSRGDGGRKDLVVSSGSFEIRGGDYEHGGAASGLLKQRLKQIGAAPAAIRQAMIAAYEAEMNVVVHARRGVLRYRLDAERLEVEVADEGPGIPDIARAMQQGFSTAGPQARELGFGAGMGLPNIERNTHWLDITTIVGQGTRLRFCVLLRPEAAPRSPAGHSLQISAARCTRCLRCLQACPTQALRLYAGSPALVVQRCIDCTRCLQACPTGALAVVRPDALPAPEPHPLLVTDRTLLGQLGPRVAPQQVLGAAARLGFGGVLLLDPWEAALRRAVSRRAREQALAAAGAGSGFCGGAGEHAARSGVVISPACPAVVNLIELRFPALLSCLAPFASPLVALRRTLGEKDAVFAITCPAQRSELLAAGAAPQSLVTPGMLLEALGPASNALPDEPAPRAGCAAADPAAQSSGESEEGEDTTTRTGACSSSAASLRELRVHGMAHVIAVLEALEGNRLGDVDVLEPWACDQGCAGSPLFPEDAFLAIHRAAALPQQPAGDDQGPARIVGTVPSAAGSRQPLNLPVALPRAQPFRARPGLRLDEDMSRAIALLARIDEVLRSLPGRDCAACGAPTCAALAEDIVLGRSDPAACPSCSEEASR